MKLVLEQFVAFSQGTSIKADIKGGWCAGVTALVSNAVGGYSPEVGYGDSEQWLLKHAFEQAKLTLAGINSSLKITESLQSMLGKIKDKHDVCGSLHLPKFDGRGCKVLLSLANWVPLFGYVSYAWQSKWLTNHIGYILRGGTKLMIFEPNYGIGIFAIQDDKALTLNEITKAIGTLAWSNSAAYYCLSYTVATTVIDEDALGMRVSHDLLDRARSLVEESKQFFSHH